MILNINTNISVRSGRQAMAADNGVQKLVLDEVELEQVGTGMTQ